MRDAFLAVLGALALTLPSAIQDAAGAPIATKHCPNECVTFVSKPIPQKLLQKYEKATCGKDAVLLTTVKNRTFCADPEVNWVQLAMYALDEKYTAPSSTVDKTNTEKQVMTHNVSGTAILPSAQAGEPAHPIETGDPARYQTTSFPRIGVSSMSTGSSAGSAPPPEAATNQPETPTNGNMVSDITDGRKALEDYTTVSPDLLTLSNSQSSILSSPTTSPGPSSAEGPTVLLQGRNFTGQSSTPFGSEGSRTNLVNMTDKRGIVNHSAISFGDALEMPSLTEANKLFFHKSLGTLPTSHQESMIEKNRAADTTSHMPHLVNSLPNILSAYRTHFIILAALGGLLCITAVAWAFVKLSIYTKSSPSDMVQGLLFSPAKYQTSVCTNDIL